MIIPALNEERRIGDTLRACVEFLEEQPWSSSVVVVDNGSTDRTTAVVDGVRSSSVPISVIGCARRGKGAAVRRGVLSTRAWSVGFCDADLATPAATLGPTMAMLRSGYPVVIGSRRCHGATYLREQPVGRRVAGHAFRVLARHVVEDVADTQCGFKFFHASVAKALFERSIAEGFAFDVEIVALARRAGLPVTEIPVSWSDAVGSSLRPLTDGPRILKELVDVRTRLRAVA